MMPDEITTYVSRYAPELDPEDVRKFMAAAFGKPELRRLQARHPQLLRDA